MEGIGDTEVNKVQFPASKILQCNLQSATVATNTEGRILNPVRDQVNRLYEQRSQRPECKIKLDAFKNSRVGFSLRLTFN